MQSADDLHELVRVTVVEISGGKVKLGFEADNDLAIHREEVWERVCGELAESTPEQEVEPTKVPRAVYRLSVKRYEHRRMVCTF